MTYFAEWLLGIIWILWIKHLAQYLGYMDIKHKYSQEPAVIYSAGLEAWIQGFTLNTF